MKFGGVIKFQYIAQLPVDHLPQAVVSYFVLLLRKFGDLGSIAGRVIPKTLKMVLDISLLNTQQYKGRIKGKVKQSEELSSALLYTSV